MTPVFITLGSNIEPEKHLREAVLRLDAALGVRAVSRVYESAPVGARGKIDPVQPGFLNAAVLVETDQPILDLKVNTLRVIEGELGRVRSSDKFAPRTMDLDIALYGDQVLGLIVEDPDGQWQITYPDPDITRFAHLALPLADLDPGFVHPVTGLSLSEIAARFQDTPGIKIHSLDLSVLL